MTTLERRTLARLEELAQFRADVIRQAEETITKIDTVTNELTALLTPPEETVTEAAGLTED
jgi:hypothetical protein